MSGWVPIFDTMHGIRGEVNITVKVGPIIRGGGGRGGPLRKYLTKITQKDAVLRHVNPFLSQFFSLFPNPSSIRIKGKLEPKLTVFLNKK